MIENGKSCEETNYERIPKAYTLACVNVAILSGTCPGICNKQGDEKLKCKCNLSNVTACFEKYFYGKAFKEE